MKKFLLFLVCLISIFGIHAEEKEYTEGIFILNEDWFGHNNSTINFLNNDGSFDYYVYKKANPGKSLGCTSQFATIYGDKIFFVSKQAQDDGEKENEGARFIVADAKTMKHIASFKTIEENEKGQSIADGRSFVGVDANTGYLGTCNGIFVFDFVTMQIKNKIEGTENPLIKGGESNADGLGPLYRNQIGMMIRSHDYVFAIQQDKGVLVIDPSEHKILSVIEGCFSTMVQSKDGDIWVGKNSNMESDGKYQTYPYGDFGSSGEKWKGDQLMKINPVTLETDIVTLPQGGINHTWYAWTAGSLTASFHTNTLYFSYNSNPWSWFTTSELYKYDIDNNFVELIYNTKDEKRYFYGAAVRANPLNDIIHTNLYLSNTSQNYWFYELDCDGNKQAEYQPVARYWFPSLTLFPDNFVPEASTINDVTFSKNIESYKIDLSNVATDKDNLDAAIVKSVKSIANPDILKAEIKGNDLILYPQNIGSSRITIQFNSNGKLAETNLLATIDNTGSINDSDLDNIRIKTNDSGEINISGLLGESVEVYTLEGVQVYKQNNIRGDLSIQLTPNRVYVLKAGVKHFKIKL